MFVFLFPLPPFPHCILPWTETKQESFTCCDIRVVLLACPLFSVKVKLVFSGMYSAEVFYCHIEDCSGKKKRYKNIKKTPQKPQWKNNSDTSKRTELIKKLEKADVLNFSYSPFISLVLYSFSHHHHHYYLFLFYCRFSSWHVYS